MRRAAAISRAPRGFRRIPCGWPAALPLLLALAACSGSWREPPMPSGDPFPLNAARRQAGQATPDAAAARSVREARR